MKVTEIFFPQYISELKGLAKGASVDVKELWTLSMEGDINFVENEKCTSIITNKGKLVSHNEDWGKDSKDAICILEKTVGDLTVFELYYYNTLGGCSVGINSYGYVHGVNTLTHSGSQCGVPRNIIARWLSETKNPEEDFEKIKKISRQLGYNHYFVSVRGFVWNIETTHSHQVLEKPKLPYVHTNHYLSELKEFEKNNNSTGTKQRYKDALKSVKSKMSFDELINLTSDISRGSKLSVFNERTIGRVVFDLVNKIVKVWLLREKDKGWVDYDIGFV